RSDRAASRAWPHAWRTIPRASAAAWSAPPSRPDFKGRGHRRMRCIYFHPMAHDPLTLLNEPPRMTDATLLLALTGWMDGGDVSTGTVKRLMEEREVTHVARLQSQGFYIDNFPGSMDVTALFRPHVRYDRGLVAEFEMASNDFYADPRSNMAFFVGKEPNLN